MTSALVSESEVRLQAPEAAKYRPLLAAAVWFLTNTRSPAMTDTPSIVWAPDRVILAVVAARALSLTSRPADPAVTSARRAASLED